MPDPAKTSTLRSILLLWGRRKWWFVVCALSVLTIMTSVIKAMPSLYRSSTTLIFTPDEMTGSPVKPAAANELELRLGLVRQNVMSRQQLQEVIDNFDLYAAFRQNVAAESVIERLRNNIRIEQKASAQAQWGQSSVYLVTIEFQDWNPDLAAKVANDLATRFTTESQKIREVQASSRIAVIAEQLETARGKFMQQEERIEAFKNEHIGELPEQQLYNMATLERLNAELRMNGERQVRLMDQRNGAAYGTGNQAGAPGGPVGLSRLESLTTTLEDLQTRYTEFHPDVIRTRKEIETLKFDIANGAGGEDAGRGSSRGQYSATQGSGLAGLRQEEMKLRNAIAAVVDKIEKLPTIQGDLKALTLDYDTARDEYLELLKLYHEAQLAESVQSHQNQQSRIIDPAIRPEYPVAPDRSALMLAGLILAIGVGGLAVFIVDQNDTSFHSVADLRRFTGVPVLAVIDDIQTAGDKFRGIARLGLNSLFLLAGLFVIAASGYYLGTNAQQLVITLSR
jgi:succinoglycan biosynthesis transport protein ExoP